jgi:protein-tyrosine-phosphatase
VAADLPSAVLFCCTMNAVRSPMAEGIMKRLHGERIYVQSVGVHRGETDPLMVEVMEEMGVDLARHRPRRFEELDDASFDVVVSLSPEAQHTAVELTRDRDCLVEYWPTFDPSLVEGSRLTRLDAYRAVRDELERRIRRRFRAAGLAHE